MERLWSTCEIEGFLFTRNSNRTGVFDCPGSGTRRLWACTRERWGDPIAANITGFGLLMAVVAGLLGAAEPFGDRRFRATKDGFSGVIGR